MEHTNINKSETNKKERRDIIISVAFIVAIFLVCFLLVIVIIILLKNIEEIKTDPIIYGMDKNDYNMCSCSDNSNQRIDYTIGIPEVLNFNEVQVIDGAG